MVGSRLKMVKGVVPHKYLSEPPTEQLEPAITSSAKKQKEEMLRRYESGKSGTSLKNVTVWLPPDKESSMSPSKCSSSGNMIDPIRTSKARKVSLLKVSTRNQMTLPKPGKYFKIPVF